MIVQSIAGLFVFSLIAWIISENRSQVRLKTILIGIFIQLVIGVILLKISIFKDGFMVLNQLVMAVESATSAGTSFVFGYLGGGQLPFDEKFPGAGFILAFKALPLVLVIGALSSLLFYWKILPFIVKLFSKALQKTMNLGGAEGLGVSANVFLGMVEAPLIISPYLKQMTRSEIFTLMTSGMATISGTVMVLYASILNKVIPDIMGHILIASIISVPAAVLISKIMVPETDALTSGDLKLAESAEGPMDAVTQGTIQGMQLAITIVAMLIVLIALVHLVNLTLGLIPEINGAPFTLQRILGYIMAPVVWFMGIPWNEAHVAGSLMGTKTILNEFIAYLDLSRLPEGVLSPKSILIITYAMCGFANPGSLGIMIGGMGTMAPERRTEIVSLGFKSIIAGTLATCMTGAVVGIFY